MSPRKSVLFVCMGNICRSPAGEGIFRQFVEKKGLTSEFDIDSAGMIGYHAGDPPDARMVQAAKKRGYDLGGCARQFTLADFDRFDLIVAMDQKNMKDLQQWDAESKYRTKMRLLTEFHPAPPSPDVPDPYYGGPEGFERVLNLIEGACEGLLKHFQSDKKPS